MFFEQYDVEPNIAVARFWLMYSGDPEQHADALPAQHEGGHKRARGDGAAPRRAAHYLVGDRLSIADIALYGYTHVAGEGGFDLEPLPGGRGLDRRASRPSPGTSRSTPEAALRRPARAVARRNAATQRGSNCDPASRSSSASAASAVMRVW